MTTPLTAAQAAGVLGVSLRQMYDLAAPAGPVACYRIGRRVSFEPADIEEFKSKCRYTETKHAVASSLSSTATLPANVSALESYFRGRGIEPRRTPSIGRRRPESTPPSTAEIRGA